MGDAVVGSAVVGAPVVDSVGACLGAAVDGNGSMNVLSFDEVEDRNMVLDFSATHVIVALG